MAGRDRQVSRLEPGTHIIARREHASMLHAHVKRGRRRPIQRDFRARRQRPTWGALFGDEHQPAAKTPRTHFSESQRGGGVHQRRQYRSIDRPQQAVHVIVAPGLTAEWMTMLMGPARDPTAMSSGGYCKVMGMMRAFVWSARTKARFFSDAYSTCPVGRWRWSCPRSNRAYLPAARKSWCHSSRAR